MPSLEESLTALIQPIAEELPPERRPALIALAERIAGARYRAWSRAVKPDAAREALEACAVREEEIASRVEAITPGAKQAQRDVESRHPDLSARYAELFEGCALPEQLALQARAERLGALTWRALAAAEGDESSAARVFLACAELEEESARALDALLADESALAPSRDSG